MKLFEHPDFDQAILQATEHFRGQTLRPAIIEKDYYVTEALRIIAVTARDKVIFKGGTSLAKAWNLIQRFSEDIDIFLDPVSFQPPLKNRAIDRELKTLRDAVGAHPALTFLPAESQTIGGFGRSDRFSYQQRFGGPGEVANRVLLEAGAGTTLLLIIYFIASNVRPMGEGNNLTIESNATDVPAVRRLTDAQFQGLTNVPPEIEWFANIDNPRTRRAYEADIEDFSTFVGIQRPDEFRSVARAHVIAWRKTLEERSLSASTIRRKLSALSSLFEYLCECNSVLHNPVDGVKRPSEGGNEGKTPAIGDGQASSLLNSPDAETLVGRRDRAILAVFLYHGLRCEELCLLKVQDVHDRRGVKHLRVHGKRNKIRFVPAHVTALERIAEYLDFAGHAHDSTGPLFRRIKTPRGMPAKPLTGSAIYTCVLKKYARLTGIDAEGVCVHSLRATAATNAQENKADIAKVQEWLGHASISTTRLYDKRQSRPEDSPTFKIAY